MGVAGGFGLAVEPGGVAVCLRACAVPGCGGGGLCGLGCGVGVVGLLLSGEGLSGLEVLGDGGVGGGEAAVRRRV